MKEITAAEFETETSNGEVLTVWSADWCSYCKAMQPVLDQLTEVKVVKIDIDEAFDLAKEYGIRSLPTYIAFRDGNELKEHVGMGTKEQLMALFDKGD